MGEEGSDFSLSCTIRMGTVPVCYVVTAVFAVEKVVLSYNMQRRIPWLEYR